MKSSLYSRNLATQPVSISSHASTTAVSRDSLNSIAQLAWGPCYIASVRIQQKPPFPSLELSNISIVACLFVAAGTCLPRRCLATNVYSDSTIPAFRRHVTIPSNDWPVMNDKLQRMWKDRSWPNLSYPRACTWKYYWKRPPKIHKTENPTFSVYN
jgi:hypothetical protein